MQLVMLIYNIPQSLCTTFLLLQMRSPSSCFQINISRNTNRKKLSSYIANRNMWEIQAAEVHSLKGTCTGFKGVRYVHR